MFNKLLTDIDYVINSYLDGVAPLFINEVIKKLSIGKNTLSQNIAKSTVSSSLLDRKRFESIDRINTREADKALRNIVALINDAFDELGDATGLSIGRALFLKDVKSTFTILSSEIPNSMHKAILDKAALTLTDVGTDKIAADLGALINKTAAQSKVLIKETLVTMNRQKIESAYERLPEDTLYKYIGPEDARTEPICNRFLGLGALTKSEWQTEKDDIFINGGHFGCRHMLVVWVEDK